MTIALDLWLQGEFWHLIAQTGLFARIILFILFFFSVLSWAIIFKKMSSFKSARRDTHEFLRVFRQSKKLSDIRASCQALKASPLVEVFLAGYREIETQAVPSENPGKMRIKSLVSIQRSLQIASSGELTRMEKWLSWLATTGSTMPFVGLLGTVWGIIEAFRGLGAAGTASLRTVAPGIADALIATAAGLFAAIPAVMAYNQFLQRIKEFGALMDDFSLEFLNMTERYFT